MVINFLPSKCPICNLDLLRTHCTYGHYTFVISSSGYANERFVIGKYKIFNILDKEAIRCEIYPFEPEVVNPYCIMSLGNIYLSPHKMTEKKIQTYITFS